MFLAIMEAIPAWVLARCGPPPDYPPPSPPSLERPLAGACEGRPPPPEHPPPVSPHMARLATARIRKLDETCEKQFAEIQKKNAMIMDLLKERDKLLDLLGTLMKERRDDEELFLKLDAYHKNSRE